MKSSKIKELSIRELEKKRVDLNLQIVNQCIRKQAGQGETSVSLRSLRRDLARCETFLKEKISKEGI